MKTTSEKTGIEAKGQVADNNPKRYQEREKNKLRKLIILKFLGVE